MSINKIKLELEKLINTELEKTFSLLEKFNKNYIATLEKIEELGEKQNKLSSEITTLQSYVLSSTGCYDKKGIIEISYMDKDYVIVPNYRTKSLINKETAIKVIEIDFEGNNTIRYTTIENLNKEEEEEFKKDGFIIKKNFNNTNNK